VVDAAAPTTLLIVAAEAVGFRRRPAAPSRAHERLCIGEIRGAMMGGGLRPALYTGAPCAGKANSGTARIKPSAVAVLIATFILISCLSKVFSVEIFFLRFTTYDDPRLACGRLVN
jgi:hypothetical protein